MLRGVNSLWHPASTAVYNRAPDNQPKWHINSYAPVAQLDRVGGFEPLGREFESLRVHQRMKKGTTAKAAVPFFILQVAEVKISPLR
jgi:hypothetical protein